MRSPFTLPLLALPLLTPTASAQCGDDAFEDNDTIEQAVSISPGPHPGLVITSSLSACGVDEDFYRIGVPDGHVLRVDMTTDVSVGLIRMWVYDDVADFATNDWIARSGSILDRQVVSVPNHSGSQQTFYLFVDLVNAFDTTVYDLEVAVFPDPCVGLPPDALEPNESCATARPVSPGLHSGLSLTPGDADYFTIDVPDGQAVRATALFGHDLAANLGLWLYDGCGVGPVRQSHSYDDDETVAYPNTSGATQSMVLWATLDLSGGTDTCLDYDLLIEVFPNPCTTLPDDAFEDNDTCQDPVLVTPGTYAGLAAFEGELDVFSAEVPGGETLRVDLLFSHADGDIDAQLFSDFLACTHVSKEVSFSTTDNESLEVTNFGTEPAVYQWELEVTIGQTGSFACNTYTMAVSVSGRTGNSFCDASDGALAACPCGNPGSPDTGCDIAQGTGGLRLDVTGQSTSPQNRATLAGSGYPATSAPGVTVIRGTALDAASPVAFGDGLRCISVPVVRVGATLASGGTSVQPIGHGAGAGPGTFYYQLWVRNTPSMFCTPDAFNLTNGRTIVW